MNSPESYLHSAIIGFVAQHGYAPKLDTLCELLSWSKDECEGVLARLSEIRGAILKPGSTDIWAIHPFTLMPTPTWVSTSGQGWWANCAWCALGIGAVLGQDIRVSTKAGAHDTDLHFDVRNGESSDARLLIHFPFKPSEWWSNPYNPCGCTLFFSAESEIDRWCTHHNLPKGEVISIATGIALAKKWFGDYLEPTWTRKTADESRELFDSLGLTGTFWS
jgi:hypothetical protein